MKFLKQFGLGMGHRARTTGKFRKNIFELQPLEQRVLLSVSANINFQPASADVPDGYLVDGGAVYGDRGNGFTYGWDINNASKAYDVNDPRSPDQRYDTLQHMQATGGARTWELAVPNGIYQVRAVMGNPGAASQQHRLNAEGNLLVSYNSNDPLFWGEGTGIVTVADGKLTLTNGTGATYNSIAFVEVRSADLIGTPDPVQGLRARAASSTGVDLAWEPVGPDVATISIERKTGSGGTWAETASLVSTRTWSNQTGLSANTTYYFRARTINAAGASSYTSEVSLTMPANNNQAAYGGTPWAVPGAIQAEDYDIGGEGHAYHEHEGSNLGNTYRAVSAAVDVTLTPDGGYGYRVGWTRAGDWAEYTVDVATAGTYRLDLRVASANPGGTVHVNFNGADQTGAMTIPQTGSANAFQTISANVTLSAGTQVMRFVVDSLASGQTTAGELNWIRLSPTGTLTPTAPSGLTATAVAPSIVTLAWTDDADDENGYRVERSTDGGTTFSTLATLTSGVAQYIDASASASTSYAYRVVATGAADSTASNTASVTTPPAVTPTFTDGDIGSPGQAGSSSLSSGVYTVNGGGADIYGTSDQFHFTYATLTGDGILTARVLSIENTHASAKAGLMVRESLNADSRHAALVVKPATGVEFESRSTTGGSTSTSSTTGLGAPYWVRIERAGDTITAHRSADGVTWKLAGTVTLSSLASTVYVGLAVTAHDNATLATATFDHVALTGAPVIPAAPTNLVATATSDTAIDVTWTDNATNETGYELEYSTSATFASGNVTVGPLSANATSYSITGLTAETTYYVRVRAINAIGPSVDSNVDDATTDEALVAPDAPAYVLAQLKASGIDLFWSDVELEDHYVIERKIGTGLFGFFDAPNADETAASDTSVSASTTYTYRVKAVTAAGGSDWVESDPVTTLPLAPAAPTGVTTAVVSGTELQVNWTAGTGGGTPDAYNIYVTTDGSNPELWNVASGTASTITLTGLSPTSAITVSVASSNASGSSSATAPASGQPGAPGSPVTMPDAGAPTNVNATTLSNTSIEVSWTDTSSNETGFIIEVMESGVDDNFKFYTSAVATSGVSNSRSIVLQNLASDTTFTFRVIATGRHQAVSGSDTATTHSIASLEVPQNVSITFKETSHIWNAHWEGSFPAGTNFSVRVYPTEQPDKWFNNFDMTAASAPFLTPTEFDWEGGSTPDFYAHASMTAVVRAWTTSPTEYVESDPVLVTLQEPSSDYGQIGVPTGLTGTWDDNDTITLHWNPVVGATRYGVYLSSRIAGANTTSLTIDAWEIYSFFKVVAVDGDDNISYASLWGEVPPYAASTPPAAPSGLASYLIGNNKVRINWTNVPNNEDGFKVQRKLHSDSTWTDVTTVGADKTSADVTLPGDAIDWTKPWDIRVISMKGGVEGGVSGAINVSGVALQSVSFGGDQAILRDNGAGAYSGAEWFDTDLDGTIDTTLTPYTNGTIDNPAAPGGQPPSEHVYPISYVRSKPAGGGTAAAPSIVYAGPTLAFNGTADALWKLEGTGGGLTFSADSASAGGGYAWATLASNALPDTIDNKDIEITWRLSTDNGVSWFTVGKSKNHLYVTGAAASNVYETVMDVGARNAKGKRPGNPGELAGDTAEMEANVVVAIFSDFSGPVPGVKRVDGTAMSYWGTVSNPIPAPPDDPNWFSTAGLVKNADGRCEAWAQFLIDVLAVQGVQASFVAVRPNFITAEATNGGGSMLVPQTSGFTVKPDAGQNNAAPPVAFTGHAVVGFHGSIILDPSYGRMFTGNLSGSGELDWENAMINQLVYEYSNNTQILKANAAVKELTFS